MQKWEYAFVDLEQTLAVDDEPAEGSLYVKLPGEDGKVVENVIAADVINQLGEQGWEVVGYASPMMSVERFVLKREKSEGLPKSFR
jgi:hypothetical protein